MNRNNTGYHYLTIFCAIANFLLISTSFAEDEIKFNSQFLKTFPGQKPADLSAFSYGNRVLPGEYLVDVYMNTQHKEKIELRFIKDKAQATKNSKPVDAKACLQEIMLERWGVNLVKALGLPDTKHLAKNSCLDLEKLISHSSVKYDAHKQQLNISVPQIFMHKIANGEITPSLWNHGITAGRVNYQLTGTNSANKAPNTFYASIESGLNIGPNRIRHRSYYNNSKFESLETTITRDIPSWRSTLTAGEFFTQGNIFPSVSVIGAQIATDTAMLPYTEQGYAPIIRGIAQTNATVTIKQNGYIIHTSLVPPGPFIIDDLAPISSQGNFEIIVLEADGRESKIIQPYAVATAQLREGSSRFQASIAKYRSKKDGFKPLLFQGTGAYGLNANLTAYGGVQVSPIYQSIAGGFGINMAKYGSISIETQHASSRNIKNIVNNGNNARFQYTKYFEPTKTYFYVSGTRYFSPNFRTFSDAAEQYDFVSNNLKLTPRTRMEYSISQPLWDGGNLGANFQTSRNWTNELERTAQVSYRNKLKKVSYSINYSKSLDKKNANEQQLSLSLSFPLDSFFASKKNSSPDKFNNSHISYYVNSNLNGKTNQNLGVFGSLSNTRKISYNANINRINNQSIGSSIGLQTEISAGNFSINHNRGHNYQTTSASFSGGIVLHKHGITFAPPLSDTIVLISAPHAIGVPIVNHSHVTTDRNGYAVLPQVSPYRKNQISLQTDNLDSNVEIKNSLVEVIPTKGAIMHAKFETRTGHKILLTIQDKKGQLLPLGSKVENNEEIELGMVGMRGQVYLSGAKSADTLIVKWNDGLTLQCKVKYSLSDLELENYKKSKQLIPLKVRGTCQ